MKVTWFKKHGIFFLIKKMCRVKEEIRTTYFRNFRACLPFEFVRIVRKENYFNISRMTIDSVITSSKSDRISYHLSSLADLLLIGFGTYLCNLCILEFFKTKLWKKRHLSRFWNMFTILWYFRVLICQFFELVLVSILKNFSVIVARWFLFRVDSNWVELRGLINIENCVLQFAEFMSRSIYH